MKGGKPMFQVPSFFFQYVYGVIFRVKETKSYNVKTLDDAVDTWYLDTLNNNITKEFFSHIVWPEFIWLMNVLLNNVWNMKNTYFVIVVGFLTNVL